MKPILLLCASLTIAVAACDPTETAEYLQLSDSMQAVRAENDSLHAVLTELRQTPAFYLQSARSAHADGDRARALGLLDTLAVRFPDTQESQEGRALQGELRSEIADSLLAAARRRMETSAFQTARNLLDEIIESYGDTRAAPDARAMALELDRAEQEFQDEQEARRREAAERQRREAADLEIIDWRWSRTAGGQYVEAEGRVRNISGQRMENVEASVTFTDAGGGFVTSDGALIELNPILPDQVSTFSVLARFNPAIERASLSFKYLTGGSIPTYRAR